MTTRDEITAARKKKRAKYRLRRIASFSAAVFILALLFCLLSLLTPTTFSDVADSLKVTFSFGGKFPVTLSDSVPLQVETMDGAFSVLTEGELMVFSDSGKQLLREAHSYSDAEIDSGESRLLLFNRGNKEALVFNRTSKLFEAHTERPIIDAAIAANGTLLVLTESDRNTAEMLVYERGGYENLVTWYCSYGFPYAVFASDDGTKAAVFAAEMDDTGLYTDVYIISLSDCKEIAKIRVESLAVDCFFEDSRIAVLSDKELYSFTIKGEVKGTYSFAELPLLSSELQQGKLLAVACGDNSRTGINEIHVFSSGRHELMFIVSGLDAIDDIYTSKDRVYVLSEDEVLEYNIRGELVETYSVDSDTVHIIFDRGLIGYMPNAAVKY